MGTFIAAYVAVWLGVVVYVGRMGQHQQRLDRRLELLEQSVAEHADKAMSFRKAA